MPTLRRTPSPGLLGTNLPLAVVALQVTTAAWAYWRTVPVRCTYLCCTSCAPPVARCHRCAATRISLHFCSAVFQHLLAHVSLSWVPSSTPKQALALDPPIASRHIERAHDAHGSTLHVHRHQLIRTCVHRKRCNFEFGQLCGFERTALALAEAEDPRIRSAQQTSFD
jgi:hypothetical protein